MRALAPHRPTLVEVWEGGTRTAAVLPSEVEVHSLSLHCRRAQCFVFVPVTRPLPCDAHNRADAGLHKGQRLCSRNGPGLRSNSPTLISCLASRSLSFLTCRMGIMVQTQSCAGKVNNHQALPTSQQAVGQREPADVFCLATLCFLRSVNWVPSQNLGLGPPWQLVQSCAFLRGALADHGTSLPQRPTPSSPSPSSSL